MTPARPSLLPDPALDRDAMRALQHEIAAAATFDDDLAVDPDAVSPETDPTATGADPPVVVGVDQAFHDDRAVSALVALQGGAVIERTHAVSPLSVPYVPGLLAFREGGPIVDALSTLSVEPDLLVVDGSGRIHFRQAGLATHVGVCFDVPAVGVAKSLLCGTPDGDLDDRPEGWSTPVRATGDVDAPEGTVIGAAYQSRQWDRPTSINPLLLSPGHRVGVDTAVDLVASLCDGYKLPEPTRLADAHADRVAAELAERTD